ncbi:MAG: hypothetical protein WCN95_01130 [bacterium]
MRIGEQRILEVNRDVRRAMVMHWIDLGRLSVHTQKDRVHIRGSLLKLPGADSPLTSSGVDIIFKKIKLAAGNRRLHIEFDNWNMNASSGAWEPCGAKDPPGIKAGRFEQDSSTQTSYKIEE